MAKNKQPYHKNTPSYKQLRAEITHRVAINSYEDHFPAWQLKILDADHKQWGWKNATSQAFYTEILDKLKNYESRKWKEIFSDKKRDHSVPIKDLCKEARDRLLELELDDFEQLWRLRLNGKQRIWGILEGYIFQILWWDPEHSVCPSNKKNT